MKITIEPYPLKKEFEAEANREDCESWPAIHVEFYHPKYELWDFYQPLTWAISRVHLKLLGNKRLSYLKQLSSSNSKSISYPDISFSDVHFHKANKITTDYSTFKKYFKGRSDGSFVDVEFWLKCSKEEYVYWRRILKLLEKGEKYPDDRIDGAYGSLRVEFHD